MGILYIRAIESTYKILLDDVVWEILKYLRKIY